MPWLVGLKQVPGPEIRRLGSKLGGTSDCDSDHRHVRPAPPHHIHPSCCCYADMTLDPGNATTPPSNGTATTGRITFSLHLYVDVIAELRWRSHD